MPHLSRRGPVYVQTWIWPPPAGRDYTLAPTYLCATPISLFPEKPAARRQWDEFPAKRPL